MLKPIFFNQAPAQGYVKAGGRLQHGTKRTFEMVDTLVRALMAGGEGEVCDHAFHCPVELSSNGSLGRPEIHQLNGQAREFEGPCISVELFVWKELIHSDNLMGGLVVGRREGNRVGRLGGKIRRED